MKRSDSSTWPEDQSKRPRVSSAPAVSNMGLGPVGFPVRPLPLPAQNAAFGTPSTVSQTSSGAVIGPSRCIYIGGVDSKISAEQILNEVFGGYVDSIRIVPEKQCAFLSFVDIQSAQIFHDVCSINSFTVGGRTLKIGWGKASPIPAEVDRALRQGATRAVFVGNLEDDMDEAFFRKDFERFGPVDTVKVLSDKKVAFIHFQSINSAIKAVQVLNTEEQFKNRKVNYAKDRCNRLPKDKLPATAAAIGGIAPASALAGQSQLAPSRSVFLGNVDPDTTYDEMLTIVRGGVLDTIKIIPEKQCCFVTFVSPEGAAIFHASCEQQAPVVRGKTLKVGWAKSSPLPVDIATAVRSGASRNVYIGHIDDGLTEEKLRTDFSVFGTVESIHIVQKTKCAFVGYTSISDAIKAISALRNKSPYSEYKLNYGTDGCAKMPRNLPQGLPSTAIALPGAAAPSALPASAAFATRPPSMVQPTILDKFAGQGLKPSINYPQTNGTASALPQPQHDPFRQASYATRPVGNAQAVYAGQYGANTTTQATSTQSPQVPYNAASYATPATVRPYGATYSEQAYSNLQTASSRGTSSVPAASVAASQAVTASPYGAIGQPYATSTTMDPTYQAYYAQQAAAASASATSSQDPYAQYYAAYGQAQQQSAATAGSSYPYAQVTQAQPGASTGFQGYYGYQ